MILTDVQAGEVQRFFKGHRTSSTSSFASWKFAIQNNSKTFLMEVFSSEKLRFFSLASPCKMLQYLVGGKVDAAQATFSKLYQIIYGTLDWFTYSTLHADLHMLLRVSAHVYTHACTAACTCMCTTVCTVACISVCTTVCIGACTAACNFHKADVHVPVHAVIHADIHATVHAVVHTCVYTSTDTCKHVYSCNEV